MSIFIFSRPIHSGKTTELLHWCRQRQNISGVLMPDINGSRKMLDLLTNNIFDIACTDIANTTEPLTRVGRFHFFTRVFEKGNSILCEALIQKPAWLVIDEAGKLELDGRGFYPAIVKAVSVFNNNEAGNLIITVRENLCTEVIRFFNIKNYDVITDLHKLA